MKKSHLLLLFGLLILRGPISAQNPYESLGKVAPVLTLSAGEKNSLENTVTCIIKEKAKINIDTLNSKNNQDSSFLNLVFMSGFKDSLLIMCDNNLINKDYFKSDFSSSFTGKIIRCNFKKNKQKDIRIGILEHNKRFCLEVRLPKFCCNAYIYHINNEWIINLSNQKMVFE